MTRLKQIIFIPGIMGSVLQKRRMPIWPWSELLPGTYDRLKDLNDSEIIANKIESFTYTCMLEKLKELDVIVDDFPYDWRKNNLSHLSLLEQKINPMLRR